MKSHMVTIRMDLPMKAILDEAAKATGRSLSGEIQYRLMRYEFMLLHERATLYSLPAGPVTTYPMPQWPLATTCGLA